MGGAKNQRGLSVLSAHIPDSRLADFVSLYWFVEDSLGAAVGTHVKTSPHATTILTVNIGVPNLSDCGTAVPRLSLAGVQNRVRTWRPVGASYIVMAMLTQAGVARLFPGIGSQIVDAAVDLGGVIGDAVPRRLLADATAACSPEQIASVFDQWFALRLERSRAPNELHAFAAAAVAIGRGANVDAAARIAGISPRQLERWCRAHMGVGPKRLAVLRRLQLSLSAVQRSQGEPLIGFSDQAHQIRTWRRYIGVTPGRYARTPASRISEAFRENVKAGREPPAFYL
jgi:AraC-like DNA-binding protein